MGSGASVRSEVLQVLARKRWYVAGVAVLAIVVLVIAAAIGVLVLIGLGGGDPLGGQSVSERDLSRAEQLALIDQFSPVPTPQDASDVRIRYQRFQDWSFEASFILAPEALEQYVSALQPAPQAGPPTSGRQRYVGKQVGAFVGWIEVDPASGRVWVHHTSS